MSKWPEIAPGLTLGDEMTSAQLLRALIPNLSENELERYISVGGAVEVFDFKTPNTGSLSDGKLEILLIGGEGLKIKLTSERLGEVLVAAPQVEPRSRKKRVKTVRLRDVEFKFEGFQGGHFILSPAPAKPNSLRTGFMNGLRAALGAKEALITEEQYRALRNAFANAHAARPGKPCSTEVFREDYLLGTTPTPRGPWDKPLNARTLKKILRPRASRKFI